MLQPVLPIGGDERPLPILAGILTVLQLIGFGATVGYPVESFGWAFYLAGYAIDIFVLFILHIRRKSQPPEDRQRTRWVQWGCWVGLLAFIIADSNEATTLWNSVWQFLKWYPSALPVALVQKVQALDKAERLGPEALYGDMPKGTALPVLAVPVIGRAGPVALALYGAHETGDDLNFLSPVL